METLSELTELDSGVASAEGTPEVQSDNSSEVSGPPDQSISPRLAINTMDKENHALKSLSLDNEVDDFNDEDFEDETLAERLWGLTEMFPERCRTASHTVVSTSCSLIKGGYSLSRQVVWVVVSSAVILFAPVLFELERLNVEEMMKQDRNRLVLGPASSISGGPPPVPGMMPPPR